MTEQAEGDDAPDDVIDDVVDDEPVPHVWAESERFVPRAFVRPTQRLMATEAAGGIVMLAAAVFALAWANSIWQPSYETLFETHISFEIGDLLHVDETLREWINEGLMAIFFFTMALEIKREAVSGELSDTRKAALPIIGALGGMVVPAAVYLAFNAGGPGADGWGIPMATDIAFAIGVLALLGSRASAGAKLFLLTLAIADDIGAILVIAVFYTDELSLGWLVVAIVAIAVTYWLQRLHVRSMVPPIILGLVTWVALLESGVSPTLAGVAFGLMAPAWSFYSPATFSRRARAIVRRVDDRFRDRVLTRHELEEMENDLSELSRLSSESMAPVDRQLFRFEPWVAYVIVPLFALANAGVELTGETVSGALSDDIVVGVILGLVVGKMVGIFGAVWAAVHLGVSDLPRGTTWRQILGVSVVAGIGFTVSLFVADLAFSNPELVDSAKIGILAGSLLAGTIGYTLLRTAPAAPVEEPAAES